ncbi:mitochondrial carrier domain-containing protein [Aspergillus oleicola]
MFTEKHDTPDKAPSRSNEQQTTNSDSSPSSIVHMHPASSPDSSITRAELFAARVPDYYVAPFCGASAGVASGIVTCPLDVIKTKLQAQGGFMRRGRMVEAKTLYRGMLGTGRIIWREDGLRGLYQGLGPMLLGYLPTWAVYLAVYDRSREYYQGLTGGCCFISLALNFY